MKNFLYNAGTALMCFMAFIGETIVAMIVVLAVAMAVVGVLCACDAKAAKEEVPVVVTTINRAEFMEPEDSGDSELPLVRLAATVDRLTGWSDLSMDEQAVRVKCAGLVLETVGKTLPKNYVDGGFFHAFCRQCGVQMQVQAMAHLGEISGDPGIAFVQGVLIGL